MNRNQCELCLRVVKRETSAHHLIPRTCHTNRWFKKNFSREEMRTTVELCRDCHHEIHEQIPSEKELGRKYHSLLLIRQHPKMARYLKWITRRM